jgi:integrase
MTPDKHLRDVEVNGANSMAIAIIRPLEFTDARNSEIVGLRWNEVDFADHCLRLRIPW